MRRSDMDARRLRAYALGAVALAVLVATASLMLRERGAAPADSSRLPRQDEVQSPPALLHGAGASHPGASGSVRCDVVGSVLDTAGYPLSGAIVTLERATTQSDARGAFALRDVARAGADRHAEVRIELTGYVTAIVPLPAKDRGPTVDVGRVTLQIATGDGWRFLYSDGAPVAGATVSRALPPSATLADLAVRGRWVEVAVTNPDGDASLPHTLQGATLLLSNSDGLLCGVDLVLDSGNERKVVLPELRGLTVNVVGNLPDAPCAIEVAGASLPRGSAWRFREGVQAASRSWLVSASPLRVALLTDGLYSGSKKIEPRGDQVVDLSVSASTRIVVSAVGADGRTIQNLVAAFWPTMSESSPQNLSIEEASVIVTRPTAADDGKVALTVPWAPIERYKGVLVVVAAPGKRISWAHVARDSPPVVNVNLTLSAGVQVEGVLNGMSRPASVGLWFTRSSDPAISFGLPSRHGLLVSTSSVSADGAFHLGGFGSGEYELALLAPGRAQLAEIRAESGQVVRWSGASPFGKLTIECLENIRGGAPEAAMAIQDAVEDVDPYGADLGRSTPEIYIGTTDGETTRFDLLPAGEYRVGYRTELERLARPQADVSTSQFQHTLPVVLRGATIYTWNGDSAGLLES